MCPFISVSSGIFDSSKHESYTSVAISGAQDRLAESERGGGIRAASGVNISLVKTILLVVFIKLANIWIYYSCCQMRLDTTNDVGSL